MRYIRDFRIGDDNFGGGGGEKARQGENFPSSPIHDITRKMYV